MSTVLSSAQCVNNHADQSFDAALRVYGRNGVDIAGALFLVAYGGVDGCLACAAEWHVNLIRLEGLYAEANQQR